METMTRYLRPRFRRMPLLLACAAGVTALWVGLAVLAYQRHELRAAAERELGTLRAANVEKPLPAPSKVETETAKRWAVLLAEREFRWAPLWTALENAASPDIELLEFQPDKPNRRVLLRGEARDEAALQAFLASLSEQRILRQVHLTHEKVRRREQMSTIAFEIKAGIGVPRMPDGGGSAVKLVE